MGIFRWLKWILTSELGQVTGGSNLVNIETELTKLLRNPFDPELTTQEQEGLSTLEEAGDPTDLLASAAQRFEQFTAPSVINRLTAAGFGRTGAVGTSLARAFAPTAGAIEAQAGQNRVLFGQSQIAAGQALSQRRASLLGRALKILSQIQGLRKQQSDIAGQQAAINANILAGNRASRQQARLNQRIAFGDRGGAVGLPRSLQPVTPGGGTAATGPLTQDQALATARARQAEIDAQIEEQRVPGGAAEIFGPTTGGQLRPGDVIGGRDFGGTISISPNTGSFTNFSSLVGPPGSGRPLQDLVARNPGVTGLNFRQRLPGASFVSF